MKLFNEKKEFFAPVYTTFEKNGIYYLMDGNAPNWISTDRRGAFILSHVNGKNSLSDLSRIYGQEYKIEASKALAHVDTFLSDAERRGMIGTGPVVPADYPGREVFLEKPGLKEFWIHTNNSCNLTCTHCLVSSSPGGDTGLSYEKIQQVIDEAVELGVLRIYFTGGEPFVRKDIFDLIRHVTEDRNRELIILTNATLFSGQRLEELKTLNRERVKLQISLDGTRKEINDPIRGEGTFEKILEGARRACDLGFETSITSVVTKGNIRDLAELPSLARRIGSKSVHLMWLHRRGRILENDTNRFPSSKELFQLVQEVKKRSREEGILFDQVESFKFRVNSLPGVKFDLGNACWESLCLYSDGHLYPSASFANTSKLDMGNVFEKSIKDILENSVVAKQFRQATVAHKKSLQEDPFRFITGGGDIEHSYFYTKGLTGKGDIEGEDPYYDLYIDLIKETMADLAENRRSQINLKSGFQAPIIYHAMGEGAISCGTEGSGMEVEKEVSLLHSNCVLSFNVEKTRHLVQAFYGKAAEVPQKELCCPVNFDSEEISHIPQEVIDRFYGCGSPISQAAVIPGETVVDLGSGGGIDCFIAAKKTGPTGKVVGIDMTPSMLEVANRNKIPVSQNLGFDVVEFCKGYLEAIPIEDKTADLITSNCVINLSADKKSVFAEMWRVLKDHGRIVISDIIAEDPVSAKLALNPQLWGECISGALTQEEFLAYLEEAGFYGLEIIKKTFWKEVEGYPFYSVTARGFKFEKKDGCNYNGQTAIYLGPFKGILDEEGHYFPRNKLVEICTDTASKLMEEPYKTLFTVNEPGTVRSEISNSPSCCPVGENETSCC
ncbi:MAG: methyltransferase domain-containing protein [Nitrospirae bacterium]|nr:methyltransferase domain-containing protein [Nitrospirota bacterium]